MSSISVGSVGSVGRLGIDVGTFDAEALNPLSCDAPADGRISGWSFLFSRVSTWARVTLSAP